VKLFKNIYFYDCMERNILSEKNIDKIDLSGLSSGICLMTIIHRCMLSAY